MILAFHFFDFDCLGQSRSNRFVVNILQSTFFVFHRLFVYGFDEYFSPLLNNPTTVSTTTVQYRHLPLPLCIYVSVRIHDTMSSKSLQLDVVKPSILRPAPNNARIHVSPVRHFSKFNWVPDADLPLLGSSIVAATERMPDVEPRQSFACAPCVFPVHQLKLLFHNLV